MSSHDPATQSASAGGTQRETPCARCGYDLRGFVQPRCPECGLEFDPDEARRGYVREHVPTPLDRADLWQPHQALAASISTLARVIADPSGALARMDLRPTATRAAAGLLLGLGWVYVMASLLLAVACYRGGLASPHTAFIAAVTGFTPACLWPYGFTVLAALPLVTDGETLRVSCVTGRQRARVACHWSPAHLACCALPACAVLAILPAAGSISAAAGVVFGLMPVVAVWRAAARRTAPGMPGLLLAALAGAAVGGLLALVATPKDLTPPLWIVGL